MSGFSQCGDNNVRRLPSEIPSALLASSNCDNQPWGEDSVPSGSRAPIPHIPFRGHSSQSRLASRRCSQSQPLVLSREFEPLTRNTKCDESPKRSCLSQRHCFQRSVSVLGWKGRIVVYLQGNGPYRDEDELHYEGVKSLPVLSPLWMAWCLE
jgi:hypothetical protein